MKMNEGRIKMRPYVLPTYDEGLYAPIGSAGLFCSIDSTLPR
jgi:hypothetical protein